MAVFVTKSVHLCNIVVPNFLKEYIKSTIIILLGLFRRNEECINRHFFIFFSWKKERTRIGKKLVFSVCISKGLFVQVEIFEFRVGLLNSFLISNVFFSNLHLNDKFGESVSVSLNQDAVGWVSTSRKCH